MTSSSNAEEGFTLLEMVCILAVIAMVAAVAAAEHFPQHFAPAARGLCGRNSLLAQGGSDCGNPTSSPGRDASRCQLRVRSALARPGRSFAFPTTSYSTPYCLAAAMIAPRFSTISFFPTGISCGGTVMLSRLGTSYEIRVNWLTGGVEIVPRSAP